MKILITDNTGGHLLSLDDFRHIQEAYQEALESVAKGLIPVGVTACILTGCELTVNAGAYTITAGAVYLDGEIYITLPGAGSTAGNDLYFELDISYAPLNPIRYETGNEYNVHEIRQLRLQQNTGLVAFHTLQRVGALFAQTLDYDYIRDQIFDIGDIRIFRGSTAGKFDMATGLGIAGTKWAKWALADGRSNTANLSGRFLVGLDPRTVGADTDYNAIGKTGGAKQVTLTTDQIPAHDHAISGNSNSDSGSGKVAVGGDGAEGITPKTDKAGGGQAHENRPPYYVVAYIEKIA